MLATSRHMTVTENPTTPSDAALAYLALDWSILPIAPGTKYPAIKEWQKTPVTSIEEAAAFFGPNSTHGVGILTGEPSGIFVLDLDGDAAVASLAELQNQHGELPATTTALTGSGNGAHLYYRCPQGFDPVTNRSMLGEGLDIRGTGGQVLAPPTIHPSGGVYSWVQGKDPWTMPPSDAPDWLMELVRRPEPTITLSTGLSTAPIRPATEDLGQLTEHIYGTWTDLLQTDGWTHARTAGTDTYWVRPGKSARDGISAVLHGDGAFVVFSTNAPTALLNHGKRTATGDGYTFSLFGYVAATRHNGDRSATARHIHNETRPAAHNWGILQTDGRVDDEEDTEGENPILAGLLSGNDILNLPPPNPMIGNWVDQSMVFQLVGPYGSAKTFALLDMALSVASGVEWLGQPIHQTGTVLYVMAEGGYTTPNRMKAWLERHDIDQLPQELHIYPDRVNLLDPTQCGHLIEAAQHLAPSLVVIDTLAQSIPGAKENDSDVMSMAFDIADRVRKLTGASVGFAHHTPLGVSGRGRGHSNLEGAMDVVISLNGQVKAGPVQMRSEKQKARANPDPMWVTVDTTDCGYPYLRSTTESPSDDETPVQRARRIIISAVHRRRTTTPLTRTEWLDRCSGIGIAHLRAAFTEMAEEGWFEHVEGDSTGRGKHAPTYRTTEVFDAS